MPLVEDLLPLHYLAKVKNRYESEDFVLLVANTISDIQRYWKHPGISHDTPPTIWHSFGKDSCATQILCALAGVPFETYFIDTRIDIAAHYTFFQEFLNWFADEFYDLPMQVYTHPTDGLALLKQHIDASNIKRSKLDKPPLNFFNPGRAWTNFYYDLIGQWHHVRINKVPSTLHVWGNRANEYKARAIKLYKHGKLYVPPFCHEPGQTVFWRCSPIGDWKNEDVFALLYGVGCPISPVYGMNDIPQKKKQSIPRTLWYASPIVFDSTYAKWLQRYAPNEFYKLLEAFPEIVEAMTTTTV